MTENIRKLVESCLKRLGKTIITYSNASNRKKKEETPDAAAAASAAAAAAAGGCQRS